MEKHQTNYSLLNFWGSSCYSENMTNLFNLTVNDTEIVESTEETLLRVLGPKRSSIFLPVTVVYLLIFLTGVSGNLLTCAVIAKHKKMRTPTNLYLVSLAMSDLIVLLFGMPLEVYDLWQNYPFPFGAGGCYFKTFLFETVCFASILGVTALSVERYVAVMHPLKKLYLSTKRHARQVISSVWAVSLACAVPNTALHGVHYLYLPEKVEESAICGVVKPLWLYKLVVQVTTVSFYVVPMMVISVLHLAMGLRLGKEKQLLGGDMKKSCGSSSAARKSQGESGNKRQVTKMLSVVVLMFGICWAPFHMDRLLWSFITQWTDLMHSVFQCVHILSGIFFYLGSAVNPVIYSLLSTRFCECFRELVCFRTAGGVSKNDSPALHMHSNLSEPSGWTSRTQVKAKDCNPLVPLMPLRSMVTMRMAPAPTLMST